MFILVLILKMAVCIPSWCRGRGSEILPHKKAPIFKGLLPCRPCAATGGNPSAAASSSLPQPLLLAAAGARRRAKPGRRRRRRDRGGCWRRAGGGARRRGLRGDGRAHARGFPWCAWESARGVRRRPSASGGGRSGMCWRRCSLCAVGGSVSDPDGAGDGGGLAWPAIWMRWCRRLADLPILQGSAWWCWW